MKLKSRSSPLAILAALTLLVSGCHSISIPTAQGPAKVKSFGQRTQISEMSWSKDGALKLKGYNNDQVSALVELFKAGLEAGKASQGVP